MGGATAGKRGAAWAADRASAPCIAAVVVLAAALRLALLTVAAGDEARLMTPDSFGYEALARSILAEGSFGPMTARTPGYPAFLAGVHTVLGPSAIPLAAVQVGLAAMVCALTYCLARRMLPEGAARLAAVLVAVDPPSVSHSLLVLTETLFTFLLVVALLLVWVARERRSTWLAAGGALALGFDVLVRPIGLYLIPLAAAWVLVPRRPVRTPWWAGGALVLVLAALPPGAWMLRNHALGQGFMLSSIEAASHLLYRAAPVLARVEGIRWEQAVSRLRLEVGGDAAETGMTWDVATSSRARRVAMEVMGQHPVETLRVLGAGAARMWLGAGNRDLLILLGALTPGAEEARPVTESRGLRLVGWAAVIAAWGLRAVVLVLMVAGLYALVTRRSWEVIAVLVGLLAYFTVASASAGAYARLRVPVTPIASIVAAAAIWGRGPASGQPGGR